jgi:hypothetical protein
MGAGWARFRRRSKDLTRRIARKGRLLLILRHGTSIASANSMTRIQMTCLVVLSLLLCAPARGKEPTVTYNRTDGSMTSKRVQTSRRFGLSMTRSSTEIDREATVRDNSSFHMQMHKTTVPLGKGGLQLSLSKDSTGYGCATTGSAGGLSLGLTLERPGKTILGITWSKFRGTLLRDGGRRTGIEWLTITTPKHRRTLGRRQ